MMVCSAGAENLSMKALVFLALIGAACKTLIYIIFFFYLLFVAVAYVASVKTFVLQFQWLHLMTAWSEAMSALRTLCPTRCP